MMKLLSSGPSPYVRKVRITLAVKGCTDQVELIAPDAKNIDELRAGNPVGKIPVLLLDDGTAIFDSQVICEYLDATYAGPTLFPGVEDGRWETLTLGAMADGILDAALLLVYEGRYRPAEHRVESWVDMQSGKIDGALTHLESAPPRWATHPHYGHITLACALGYLDFRHEGRWRAACPNLVAWLDEFSSAVPGFVDTRPDA
jgi:glutathione S-transferase